MIPLKLEKLLEGQIVERDRVEYKKGWNPNETIQTICAYANDFHNMNGGYVVIGIEEKEGMPLLPPEGVAENQLDIVQQKIFEYCNEIEPRYVPRTEIIAYQGKWVLYLWCSAGDDGPYKVQKSVVSKNKGKQQKEYWIKVMSVKTVARRNELGELFEKFASSPLDDRVNREATISDIRRGNIDDYLNFSDSVLFGQRDVMPTEDILQALEVVKPSDIGVDIRNIGLLMFCDCPQKFIPGAQIDLVWFRSIEEEASNDFTERSFTGPINKQIVDALHFIDTSLIVEKVVKVPRKAEALRFFNYPYEALEETLVNAVFHKSYSEANPVEIRIYPNRIMIINYPGPDSWINMGEFCTGKAVARKYRNRRIGEFLKELDLSEKQSTGIRKILSALEKNGSPLPEFKTDKDRTYLITTIHIHKDFNSVAHDGGFGPNNEKKPIKAEKKPIKAEKKPIKADKSR